MRPYSLMEDSPESLEDHEISRGRLHKLGQNGFVRKSFDIMSAFLDVLGKPAAEVPDNYERGENLHDSAMELETNSTRAAPRTSRTFACTPCPTMPHRSRPNAPRSTKCIAR